MLQPFDIIFHKGRTPIARIIRKLTKSQYSHCALILDSMHLLQLDWKTPVSIQHFEYPMGQYDVYRLKVELTEQEKKNIILFMRDRMSTKYDWKLIYSRFFNILFGTPIVSSKFRYNCDELILDALRSQNINLIREDVSMTPDTLSKSELLYKIVEVE